ncbi:replication-associated recombination protein A [Aestuariibacter salexigens]|uniref:replication-associated recombination protein A n=1 Tax=Aestuariibacter salexigens TaxID=226010 RepID=UPI000417A90D|nr:replication-associated recombination protein A [Aestuariibacter salexigens]
MRSQDLFNNDASSTVNAPLASRLRPQTLSHYIGQSHLLSEGRPLFRALQSGSAHSMILWGPPGSGKTSLAEMIARHCHAHVIRLSAVTSGVKDIRQAVQEAKDVAVQDDQQTILFVDEVHRFNKSQQDAFLPYIEDGTITFIGATTENPSFELNSALLSRARVYILKPLTDIELSALIERALQDTTLGLGDRQLSIADDAKAALLASSGGDARRLLNTLELAADLCEVNVIELSHIADAVGTSVAQFDKQGDHYYDMLSAFHKSVRGSSPDAAVYWIARMLTAGCEATVIARRLLAIASEDIGNADPRALTICVSAWDTYHRVGKHEGERAIAQAAIYCACAAKSNAVYAAFNQAMQEAKQHGHLDVPAHLRNAPTALAKQMNHGAEYRYAHDYDNAYAAGECYLPEEIKDTRYYQPNERGMESKIKQKLDFLRQQDDNSPFKRYS